MDAIITKSVEQCTKVWYIVLLLPKTTKKLWTRSKAFGRLRISKKVVRVIYSSMPLKTVPPVRRTANNGIRCVGAIRLRSSY